MIVEADKKIIDLHQEVYLAFYDLTGITVGVVLFVNMLIENALFMHDNHKRWRCSSYMFHFFGILLLLSSCHTGFGKDKVV